MLKADRQRAFGIWLLIAILLCFLTMCADVFSDITHNTSNAMMTFLFCGAITPVYAVTAVIACLPFATGFTRDWRSGAAVTMQLRCGRKRFLISKILSALLSGGLALGIGTALFALLLNLRLDHDYTEVVQIISEATYYDVSQGFTTGSLIGYYAVAVTLEFFAGMFYASIGLAISAFVPNISLTLCGTLVMYRVLKETAYLMPAEWMVPIWLQIGSVSLDMGHTLLAGIGVFSLGILVCSMIFYCRAARRLRYA